MLQYVDDMRARLTEVSDTEQALIRALGDALTRVDQKLLADVRDVMMGHEARRVAILAELQTLASRIGAFPAPREPVPSLEVGGASLPAYAPPSEQQSAPQPGDWRQAVSNIKDGIETHFGRRSSSP
jgi:hypothetical protein